MKMKEEPKDIKTIFSEALEKKDVKERADYLNEACGNDAELRAKVEALLKAHQEAGSFLDVPPFDADVTLNTFPLTEGPGTIIGRYKLLEQIGEGGFGVVYMAEQQEPIRRRVALKIIKLGMDTKQVIEIGSTSSLQVGFDWVCFHRICKVVHFHNTLSIRRLCSFCLYINWLCFA
jgi:serine/threonine protein kinase